MGFNTEIVHIDIQTSDIIADLNAIQNLFESYTHRVEIEKMSKLRVILNLHLNTFFLHNISSREEHY